MIPGDQRDAFHAIAISNTGRMSAITQANQPGKKVKIAIAIASHIQVLIHNLFFWLNFLILFKIQDKLDDIYPNLTTYIFAPIIFFIMLGTTITFVTSILPAVTEDALDPRRRVNDFLTECQNSIAFEKNNLLDASQMTSIDLYINQDQLAKDLKLNNINNILKHRVFENVDLLLEEGQLQTKIQGNGFQSPEHHLLYYHSISKEIIKKAPKDLRFIAIKTSWPRKILAFLKNFQLKWVPTASSFASFFLANNFVLEILGPTKHYSLLLLWIAEFLIVLLCLAKSFVTYKRKFQKSRVDFDSFIYYLLYATPLNRLQKKYSWEFIKIVVLPNIAATVTYMASAFFFVKHGCISQIEQVFARLFNRHFDFDPQNPHIPTWQYYIAAYLVFTAMGTMLFTQGPTSWKQYKAIINENDKQFQVTYHKAWKVAKIGIWLDANQTLVQIFVSVAASVAFILAEDIASIQAIIPAIILSLWAAYSYLHFQKIFGKEKFDETCEKLQPAVSWIKGKLNCLPCSNTTLPHTSLLVGTFARRYHPIADGEDMFHKDGYPVLVKRDRTCC